MSFFVYQKRFAPDAKRRVPGPPQEDEVLHPQRAGACGYQCCLERGRPRPRAVVGKNMGEVAHAPR